MANQQEQSNYDVVKHGYGTKVADAIVGLVREEIREAIDGLRQDLPGLVVRQAENVKVAKAEGSSEAAKVANKGSRAVQAAEKAVQAVEADPEPTPKKVEEAKEAVKQADKAVDDTKKALAQRIGAIEEVIAPWRKGEKLGSRKPSRFDPIEEDMIKLAVQIDQAEASSREALAVASARRGPALWLVGAVTFAVAFVIIAVLAIFTSLTIFWDAVWLAAATTTFVVIVTWLLEKAPSKIEERQQKKATSHKDDEPADAGTDILQPQH